MVSLVRLIALLCFSLMCGCDDTKPATDVLGAAMTAGPVPLSPLPGLSADRFDQDLEGELGLVDPSKDGWATEVVSDAILKTMKDFDAWVRSGPEGDCPLELASDFEGVVETEESLDLVYEREPFRIRRVFPRRRLMERRG